MADLSGPGALEIYTYVPKDTRSVLKMQGKNKCWEVFMAKDSLLMHLKTIISRR